MESHESKTNRIQEALIAASYIWQHERMSLAPKGEEGF